MLQYLIFCLVVSTVTAGPATFINRCKAADSKCIKESTASAIPMFVAGIPELGIDAMDPLHFDEMDASSSNLKLIIRDATVKGLKDCKPKKIVRDIEKSKLYVRLMCDVIADAHYDMKGKILIIPIEGNDKVHIELKKILIAADVDMGEIEGKGSKKYWDIKDWKYSFELKDKAVVDFKNLFPGNEILGRTARELVANNANDIIMEVGPPIIKKVTERLIQNINHFFHQVPAEDLSLD